MKKIISILVCLSILSGCLVPVLAADTSEYERVLSSVKERIGSTDEYTEFSGEEWENNGDKRYSFYWNTSGDEEYKYMSIECTPDGVITSYYKTDNNRTSEPSIKKITTGDAMEKAKELIRALNPDVADKLEITPSESFERLYGNVYYFDVVRYENGFPVPENSGSLRLNADCSEITSFNISYNSAGQFKSPGGMLLKNEALETYGEKLPLKLTYKYKYNDRERSVYLSYSPEKYNSYIDALSGEVFTPEAYTYRFGAMQDASNEKAMASGGSGGFTKAEAEGIEKIEGLISKEEAEKILRDNKALLIDENAAASALSLRADYYDKNAYTYSFNFSLDTEEGKDYYCYATIDAVSGQILSYSSQKGYTEDTEAQKARELSEKLLPYLAQDKLGEFVKKESEETDASLRYVRLINGIEFEDNAISITSNPETESVSYFGMSYDNVTAPSPDGILSGEDALAKLSEQLEYYPAYKQDKDNTYRLVYMFENDKPHEIDAFSGKLVRGGEEYTENMPAEYSDINGHYAEKHIKTLASYGISLEGDTFRPDDVMLQKDYIAYLTAAFGGNTSIIPKNGIYDEVYSRARDCGILTEEEKDPDSPVTREMAAVYMVRAIGAEKYAQLHGIYKNPFPDVFDFMGHIAILKGFGVVSGDENGSFNPVSHITRADSAVMIYNYLAK